MTAGSTYSPIATTTLVAASRPITFSSIPSTYTDLKLVYEVTNATAVNVTITFNNDSTTVYSQTGFYTDGNNIYASGNLTANAAIYLPNSSSTDTTIPSFGTIDILSYTSSTYKTALCSYSNAYGVNPGQIEKDVALWRSTSVINTISITASSNFKIGSTFTLYGIAAA